MPSWMLSTTAASMRPRSSAWPRASLQAVIWVCSAVTSRKVSSPPTTSPASLRSTTAFFTTVIKLPSLRRMSI